MNASAAMNAMPFLNLDGSRRRPRNSHTVVVMHSALKLSVSARRESPISSAENAIESAMKNAFGSPN